MAVRRVGPGAKPPAFWRVDEDEEEVSLGDVIKEEPLKHAKIRRMPDSPGTVKHFDGEAYTTCVVEYLLIVLSEYAKFLTTEELARFTKLQLLMVYRVLLDNGNFQARYEETKNERGLTSPDIQRICDQILISPRLKAIRAKG